MPIAFPKPCAHNRRLTASKPLSLAGSRAGQSNAGWKQQLCPRHSQQQAPHVSRAPHPPSSSSAPTSAVPSSFTLSVLGLFVGAAFPQPSPGSIQNLSSFQHRLPQVVELGRSGFLPGKHIFTGIFQPAGKEHGACHHLYHSGVPWGSGPDPAQASTLAGR